MMQTWNQASPKEPSSAHYSSCATFINDLPDRVKSRPTVRMFADDCLIYREIKSRADQIQLQHDLLALQKWADSVVGTLLQREIVCRADPTPT